MSAGEYFQYVTAELIRRLEKPKKNDGSTYRLPWYVRAFGLIPLALFMVTKRKRR